MSDSIADFRTYLEDRALSPETVGAYVGHLQAALSDDRGLLGAFRDDYAPKTLWTKKAALVKYMRFQGKSDEEIREAFEKVRLPPAVREKAKLPLETEQIKALIAEVDTNRDVPDAVRAVIGIMATRGLRVGDVLRAKKSEIQEAARVGVLSFKAKKRVRLEYRMPRSGRYLDLLLRAGDGQTWECVWDLVSPDAKQVKRASAKAVTRWLRHLAMRVGIPPDEIHPHRLRRTYVVHFLRALKNDPEALPKVKAHMGWADLDTTLGYVDYVRQEEMDDVEPW